MINSKAAILSSSQPIRFDQARISSTFSIVILDFICFTQISFSSSARSYLSRAAKNSMVISIDHIYSSSKHILSQRITLIYNLNFFNRDSRHLPICESLNKCIFHIHLSPHILDHTRLNSIKSLTATLSLLLSRKFAANF